VTLAIWRLVPERRSESAFDGEGARLYGGRWNSPGSRVVYASESRALAVLEMLVHLPGQAMTQIFSLFKIEFEAHLLQEFPLRKLPANWHSPLVQPDSQFAGDQWIRGARSAVLRVPSAVIPEESNYLLNPLHPDFSQIRIDRPKRFAFDPRLQKTSG